jgi:hypothetical protein
MKPSELLDKFTKETIDNIYTNSMKAYYKYTITVESEDWMHPEVIEEDLGEVFDPFGLDNKLKGIVTKIKREKVETK